MIDLHSPHGADVGEVELLGLNLQLVVEQKTVVLEFDLLDHAAFSEETLQGGIDFVSGDFLNCHLDFQVWCGFCWHSSELSAN